MRRAICGACLEDCLVDPRQVGNPERGVYHTARCPRCGAVPLYTYDDPPTAATGDTSTTYRQMRVTASPIDMGD